MKKCDARSYGDASAVAEKRKDIIRVRKAEKAYPAGLKQSPAKLLESHGVSINLGAIVLRPPRDGYRF